MNIHRLSERVLVKQGFAGGITNGTQAGTAIDTLGARRVTFLVHIKTGSATTAYMKVQECDTSGGTFTDIASSSQPATPLAASSEAIYLIDVDLKPGRKRWVAPAIVGTGTAGDVEVFGILYDLQLTAPTQDQPAVSV